jgi:plasmid stabilization system protein ParE
MAALRPRNGSWRNAGESFSDLSSNPRMGAPLSWRSPKLAGLRKWRVSGFESFLIFYLPCPDGVAIVRVLHAAQDWWPFLEFYEHRLMPPCYARVSGDAVHARRRSRPT